MVLTHSSPRWIPNPCAAWFCAWWVRAGLVGLLLCWPAIRAPGAPKPGASEYAIKATFLFHFTKFIEWPRTAFATTNAPLVVGVVGRDPFGASLIEALRGESVHGHPVQLRALADVGETSLKQCHVLFIAASEKERLGAVLAAVQRAPALTVSEIDRFGQRGGLVNFYKDAGAVKFEINLNALRAAGLKANSQLLRLARIVESETPPVMDPATPGRTGRD